jgi:hypothetical protein
MSDVAFARGDQFTVFTVDVARGGGTYNRLASSPTGKAAIAHSTNPDYRPEIWLDRETDQGWQSQRLFAGEIREQLGFGVGPTGLHTLACFDSDGQLLMYRESPDGETWTAAENVDRIGVTGCHPSLAFDAQGNPAIAYYRCGDYGVAEGCDANKDGLYLARRQSGIWNRCKVLGESGVKDGLYTALTFVDGKAVIAYQLAYFDPIANTSKVSLQIAKEM